MFCFGKNIMKIIPFFIFLLTASPAFSEGIDIPLLKEDLPISALQDGTKIKHPNIGKTATPLKSLDILPPPFPSVKIDLPQEKKIEEKKQPKINEEVSPSAPLQKEVSEAVTKIEKSLKLSQKEKPFSLENLSSDKFSFEKKNEKESPSSPSLKKEEKKEEKAPKETPLLEKKEFKELSKLPTLKTPSKKTLSVEKALEKEDALTLSDVFKFDIAGFSLGMKAEEVSEIASKKGFRVVRENYSIPDILKIPYEDICKAEGIYQVSAIQNCMIQKAKEADLYSLSEIILDKRITREKIVLSFSSPFKGNKAYKVFYINKGNNSLGSSPRDQERRDKREKLFFDLVYEKYNYPDDSLRMIWGKPQDTYMKAYITGGADDLVLVLEDVLAQDEEAYLMNEIKKNLPKDIASFSFYP